MATEQVDPVDRVGPVLLAEDAAHAIVAAIRELNSNVKIVDRGSYLRVLVPRRCVVTRAAIEKTLGRPFPIPGELEALMPSFQGRFKLTEDEASWTFEGGS